MKDTGEVKEDDNSISAEEWEGLGLENRLVPKYSSTRPASFSTRKNNSLMFIHKCYGFLHFIGQHIHLHLVFIIFQANKRNKMLSLVRVYMRNSLHHLKPLLSKPRVF